MDGKITQETEFVTICEEGFGPVVPYGPVEHEDGDEAEESPGDDDVEHEDGDATEDNAENGDGEGEDGD